MLKVASAHALAADAADAFCRGQEGQTMAEYGVVLAVITPAIIAALVLLSDNARAVIEGVAGLVPG